MGICGRAISLFKDSVRTDRERPSSMGGAAIGRLVGIAKRQGEGEEGKGATLGRSRNNPRQTTTYMCNSSSDRPQREPHTHMSESPPSGTWPVSRLIA